MKGERGEILESAQWIKNRNNSAMILNWSRCVNTTWFEDVCKRGQDELPDTLPQVYFKCVYSSRYELWNKPIVNNNTPTIWMGKVRRQILFSLEQSTCTSHCYLQWGEPAILPFSPIKLRNCLYNLKYYYPNNLKRILKDFSWILDHKTQ